MHHTMRPSIVAAAGIWAVVAATVLSACNAGLRPVLRFALDSEGDWEARSSGNLEAYEVDPGPCFAVEFESATDGPFRPGFGLEHLPEREMAVVVLESGYTTLYGFCRYVVRPGVAEPYVVVRLGWAIDHRLEGIVGPVGEPTGDIHYSIGAGATFGGRWSVDLCHSVTGGQAKNMPAAEVLTWDIDYARTTLSVALSF